MIVRKATCNDFEKIDPLLKLWIKECNPDHYDFEPELDTLKNSFINMNELPWSTTFVMVNDNDDVVGCLGLIKHGWGADPRGTFVSENLWYILPKYAGHANKLLNAAKKWTKEKKAKYLLFSKNKLSSSRSEKSKEWLMASGFKPLYELFITEVT